MNTFLTNSIVGNVDPDFWRGKKIFVTGHTGFKGSWLCLWLSKMGAKIYGYSLEPITNPNFYGVVGVASLMEYSYISDIRNLSFLKNAMNEVDPDVLIHLAAQPLVRYSFANPVDTYETNVMGTVNVLEAARNLKKLKAILIITSDKCYENNEWDWSYRENDPIGGADPYSSSKACVEIISNSYRHSFLSDAAISTARAGNVIGGGDWSIDRLIPDAITSFEKQQTLILRNPGSVRPWQHVLEPLSGYLILAQALFEIGKPFEGPWNFGPTEDSHITVEKVINILSNALCDKLKWKVEITTTSKEASLLKLDCSKARKNLRWNPKWDINQSIEKTIEWHRKYKENKNMKDFSMAQINSYISK